MYFESPVTQTHKFISSYFGDSKKALDIREFGLRTHSDHSSKLRVGICTMFSGKIS